MTLSMAAMEAAHKCNQTATYYHERSTHQKEVGHNLVAMINTGDVKMILDLGCGTGHLAAIMSELTGPESRIIAVDPDASRINLAKEVNARLNIEYLVADDESFPGSEFEVIISNHVIHWIKNKEALFKRIYEKLSFGGKFLFVTFEGTPRFPPIISRAFSRLICPDFGQYLLHDKWCFLNSKEYRSLAESAGLTVTKIQVQQTNLPFKSVIEFLEFWVGVCQGDIDPKKIDPVALQEFTKSNEEELIECKFELQVLYMECTKQVQVIQK